MEPEEQIILTMANRITELEASIPEHLAAGRPVAADMALYGARELRNILDLTAGPRWPVWAAEMARALDESNTEEASSAEENVRVFHRPDGWVLPSLSPDVQDCTSNFHRQQDGRPPCTNTAVWKVVEHHDSGLSIGFYCDTDLPAEHRRLAADSTA